jgi:glutamine synthetase
MYIIAEYIWLDANDNFRSKVRVIQDFTGVFPDWTYDGSSTGQSSGENTDIILKPVYSRRMKKVVLVLCETYYPDGFPLPNNHRLLAKEIFKNKPETHPWFGLEQEYFIYKDNKPLGYNQGTNGIYYCGVSTQQGRGFGLENEYFIYKDNKPLGYNQGTNGIYYCGVGTQQGREFVEEHFNLCLETGLKMSGFNAEVVAGQWEFQVGPVEGLEAGDQLMLARYLLVRLSEKYGYTISFHPKPLKNENGSGCHCNFSTELMRKEEKYILEAINKLEKEHELCILNYGKENELRLSGNYETSDISKFSYGYSTRNTSIRIPVGNKYIEDRRPASNCDPYLVTSLMYRIICLD